MQKVVAIVLFFILLAAIPFTIWYGTLQQQTVSQHAATIIGKDPCGHLSIWINEIPAACSTNKVQAGMTSYGATLGINYKTGNVGTITVTVGGANSFCATYSDLSGSNAACIKNAKTVNVTKTLAFGDTTYVSVPTQSPSTVDTSFAGLACGYYQSDFSFSYSVNGQSCTFGSMSDILNNPGAASFCNAGKDCTAVSPSPSPTPTISVTPTGTPVVTPTDTPIPTPTPTPGPTSTPVPTIPGPSATPTSVPPTITRKPTLPPTGPGNTIIGIGVAGFVTAALGAAIILGL